MFRSNIKFFILIAILTLPVAVLAAWRDAPAGPPNYGSFSPDTQADYKPMNLGDAVQTKTGGLNIMGNVGIGTTGPGAKLTVNNPTTSDKTGSAGDAIYAYANSANATLSVEQGNSSGFAVYSSGGINYFGGNVGIGTTNPGQKLSVAGTIESTSVGFKFPDGTIQNTAVIAGGGNVVGLGTPGYDSYLPKWISSSGNALGYSDIYNSGGNVGIGGTASPGYKLTVNGSILASLDTVTRHTLYAGLDPGYAGLYLYNGYIRFPDGTTQSTAASGGGGDGNNYTTGMSFSGSGTKTLTLNRSGLSDLTASFTDNDTTYSAGTNLSLSGNTFSVVSNPTFSGNLTVNGVTVTIRWLRALGSVEIEGKFIRNYGVFSDGQVYCSPLTLTSGTTFTCANPMVRVSNNDSSIVLNGTVGSASAACLALGGNGVVNSNVIVSTNGATRGIVMNSNWGNIQNCPSTCSTPYITSLVCNY